MGREEVQVTEHGGGMGGSEPIGGGNVSAANPTANSAAAGPAAAWGAAKAGTQPGWLLRDCHAAGQALQGAAAPAAAIRAAAGVRR